MTEKATSLLDYIQKDTFKSPIIFDALRYEIGQQIYYYGAQFKNPKEQSVGSMAVFYNDLIVLLKQQIKVLLSNKTKAQAITSTKKILSNAYFSVNKHLHSLGFNVYTPIWWLAANTPILSSKEITKEVFYFQNIFNKSTLNKLTNPLFIIRVEQFYTLLKEFFIDKKVKAVIVPNDMSFFENLSISACKECNIPTFVFLHGLPGRYNAIDENRANYLLVWGEAIKQNYVRYGFDPSKILVTGHPSLSGSPPADVRFAIDSILVLTKSMNGAPYSDAVRLQDRGNSLLYLRSMARVLRRLGVRNVRLRPHPSESCNWYVRNIDNSFYKIDRNPLTESLKKTSLVIGPTSTVLLETIYNGINYLVYEPLTNGLDLTNFPLVPPFDGSDNRVPVATNEDDLHQFLLEKRKVNACFFSDYAKVPFDISILKELI